MLPVDEAFMPGEGREQGHGEPGEQGVVAR